MTFRMRQFLLFLFLSFSLVSFSQKNDRFREAVDILNTSPDSAYVSVATFSSWLKENFHSGEDLLCAIYVWSAGAISYDVEKMYLIRYEEKPEDMIESTFRTRKAVCQGYSELFNDLCRRCGISSYVVNGYTKQNGEISSTGHAWVVARLEDGWYCFDPTWGAGYVQERKFYRRFSQEYYMIRPEAFIATHMPLDPMWQLLEHPYSIQDFYSGIKKKDDKGSVYSYNDSINNYMQMNRFDQFGVTLRRVNEAGIYNNVIQDYARYLAQTLENEEIRKRNEYQKQQVDHLNLAVDHYNTAVKQFNEYVNYYNRQFKPVKSDPEIREMIDVCDRELMQAQQLIEKVDPFSMEIRQNIEQLEYSITVLKQNVYDQEKFVKKYLSTPSKSGREKLFRQQY
jgi:hypothetical protein